MQGELSDVPTTLPIRILGINGIGQESGNSTIVAGRTIPWLQDTSAQDVWSDWKVTYRDVIVLDGDNKVAGIYNLTDHDLAVTANYDSLKALLVKVANQ
jgi:hypothetical protein